MINLDNVAWRLARPDMHIPDYLAAMRPSGLTALSELLTKWATLKVEGAGELFADLVLSIDKEFAKRELAEAQRLADEATKAAEEHAKWFAARSEARHVEHPQAHRPRQRRSDHLVAARGRESKRAVSATGRPPTRRRTVSTFRFLFSGTSLPAPTVEESTDGTLSVAACLDGATVVCKYDNPPIAIRDYVALHWEAEVPENSHGEARYITPDDLDEGSVKFKVSAKHIASSVGSTVQVRFMMDRPEPFEEKTVFASDPLELAITD